MVAKEPFFTFILQNNEVGKRFKGIGKSFEWVILDTPKLEFLKEKMVLIEENGKIFKFSGTRREEIKKVEMHSYPIAKIKGKVKETELQNLLFYKLFLLNPLTGQRVTLSPFFLLNNESGLPLFDFLRENFTKKFVEIETPIILDEDLLGLKITDGLNLFDGLRRAILKEIIKIKGYCHFFEVDLEYLHQLRVSLRKIRSYLKVFGEVFSVKRAMGIMSSAYSFAVDLGCVRDIDIFIFYLENFLEELKIEKRKDFIEYFSIQRDFNFDAAKRVIKTKKFQNFIERVTNLVKKREKINLKARKNFKKEGEKSLENLKKIILKRVKKFKKTSSLNTLHKIRILFKRYRYIYEIVHKNEKKRDKKEMQLIEKIQDVLGFCQDMRMFENFVREFIENEKDKQKTFIFGQILQLAKQKREIEVKYFLKLFEDFK